MAQLKDLTVTGNARVVGKIYGTTTNAEKVNNLTVQTAVPENAVFTDTTYESKAAASGGTDVSLVTTGEKYNWNNKGSGTITGVSVNGTSVATSGIANITTAPASILFGDIPSAVTATTQNPGDNSTKIATTAYVDRAISSPFVTKTYTDIIGVTDNTDANCAFFFGSVRPNSFTDIWAVKYRIYVWCENNNNYKAVADCFFEGSQSNVASYAVFNNIYNTSYRPVHYHSMYRLTQAGYDANYGHALGFSLRDSTERLNTSLKRTVQVELLEYRNCTVTFNDEAVKWANWAGGNSTNYGSIQSYNFSANGLQETGDANDNSIAWHIRSYYERTKVGPNKLFQYNLCTYTSGDKLEGFVNSASIATTKTKNTTTFRLGAPIYYYNSATNLEENTVAADNTLNSQNANVDLRYSTNCAKTLTTNLPVYLVGIPNKANFTLDDTWYTQTLPSTEDGKIYILLGIAYNSYQIAFNLQHPIYWYKDGAIQLYQMPISSNDVTTALGYTPYNSTNPNGYTSNTGTITKVQANGTDVASSGTANIPAASTSTYGVTKLSNATDSTSEVLAATPKAVKAAYDLAAGKGTGTITGVSVNNTSVATSGVANITSIPASILTGAIPSAVTATTQVQTDNSTKIATTAFVKTAIDNLPDPMVFKGSLGTGGTITALPVDGSANIGDTYKVITDGTYASKAAKVGDTFICLTKTSNANTWELIPSGDDAGGTVTSVKIQATSPIAIDSDAAITTSGTRTLSHVNSGVTAGTYKSVTVNATGHVTGGTNPTTISGYGITDAKIASGVITLGSNTITPLTASSTLDATKLSGTIPSGCYTDTKYTAGTGLTLDGTQFKHSNSVTAATAGTSSATSGSTLAVPYVTYDAQGHIIASGTHTHTITGFSTTDTKNTAGSTDTSDKIYLIGAVSQAANPQTYSDNEVFVTNGVLQAKSYSINGSALIEYNSTDSCIEFNFV